MKLIDYHVHCAALPTRENRCYIPQKMLDGFLFQRVLKQMNMPMHDPEKANQIYIEKLAALVRASRFVEKAVLLAMDGVYDAAGRLDLSHTNFFVTNQYVLDVCKQYPDCFLPGVSINPQRRDALEELARCAEQGAFLVKWLPNSQEFSPDNPKWLSFYRALVQYKIPLLSHVGYEFSLKGKDQRVGDLERLRLPLDEGVVVIGAHGASHGLFLYEKQWDTFLAFIDKYPHFYSDVSALSLPNRVNMLIRIRRHPEVHNRLVFGTDYPLSCFAYPPLLLGNVPAYWRLRKIKNIFDRQYTLLQEMGIVVKGSLKS